MSEIRDGQYSAVVAQRMAQERRKSRPYEKIAEHLFTINLFVTARPSFGRQSRLLEVLVRKSLKEFCKSQGKALIAG